MSSEVASGIRAGADVIVIEDDPDIAMLIAMVLSDFGYQVRLAGNGEEGLRLVDEKLPDVILSDVEMPVLDGPGVAMRLLVTNAGRERIPVVIMSGLQDLPRIAARVGTPYVLPKPFAPRALLDLLALAVRERRPPSLNVAR